MRPDLPSGTVTFLFTDVEGSTKLLDGLGPEGYAAALAEHRRLVREAFAVHGGVEVDTQGDAFFVAFPTADGALAAAEAARDALADGQIRVRMGIHTGTPHLGDEGYVGADVHRAARIAAAGHGGQVLVSAATAALVGTDGLRELGEHRLKDFAEPVPIYQLGDERFPPLRTISNTNLPRPASSFVGRDREVEEVAALLRDGARLLTLTGPGGSGKTRLGIEAAASLVPEFKAGVFWVGLAPLRDPGLVTETIGQTLGANDGLADHIGEREMLLLIDNLEQVIDAAPELAGVVESCPNLRLLVTSRELLRVRGEVEYPVLPLADPEAVDLFCARAQTEPDDPIRRLCRALDNLPLAIELAAARASILTPAQILERLSQRLDLLMGGRDADPRQQTLRATTEWSFELLNDDEQRLFARLSVFAGGCTLNAAEAIAEADLDTLQSLVDKSLVRRTAERFWMLETIREFAAERLEAAGEADEVRRRHAEYFLARAEEAEPHLLHGEDTITWLDRLESEHDNIRAALDRSEGWGDKELTLRLAVAMHPFWEMRSHYREGLSRLRRALAEGEYLPAVRAKALVGASVLAGTTGDVVAARDFAEEALVLCQTLGDGALTAHAFFALGDASNNQANVAGAEHLLEESQRLFREAQALLNRSVDLFREFGDEHNALLASYQLSYTYIELGDRERGMALREAILRRARGVGDDVAMALALGGLVRFAFEDERMADAVSLLRDAIRIQVRLGDQMRIALLLGRLAHALARLRRAETAANLLAFSLAHFDEIGAKVLWTVPENEETLATIRTHLGDAEFAEAWVQGERLSLDEAVGLSLQEAAHDG